MPKADEYITSECHTEWKIESIHFLPFMTSFMTAIVVECRKRIEWKRKLNSALVLTSTNCAVLKLFKGGSRAVASKGLESNTFWDWNNCAGNWVAICVNTVCLDSVLSADAVLQFYGSARRTYSSASQCSPRGLEAVTLLYLTCAETAFSSALCSLERFRQQFHCVTKLVGSPVDVPLQT